MFSGWENRKQDLLLSHQPRISVLITNNAMKRSCLAVFCRSKSTQKMPRTRLNPIVMVGQNTFKSCSDHRKKSCSALTKKWGMLSVTPHNKSITWQKLLQKHIRKAVRSSQTYFNSTSSRGFSSAQCWGLLQWVSWPPGCLKALRISSLWTAACWRWQETRNGTRT